jgi:NADPH:quinone reductase-like Zn-dependent oxidoreductase
MQTMKAVRIHEYGAPDVLVYEDAPRPEPGTGEVLVRVHAAALNPVDWKIRAGYMKNWLPYTLPMILGWDFSGVIDSVGPDAGQWKPGDQVFGRPDISRDGAYAEYLVVRASEIAVKPRSVDHIHSAALPLAGLTAWQALFETAGLSEGQSVLVHAAAGGVGSLAVQLAKWAGAHVAGTASGRNQYLLRDLGVDQPIDYQATRFEDVVHDVDVVLDSMAGEIRSRSWKVLKKGGILVTLLGQGPLEEAASYGVRGVGIMAKPDRKQLDEIAALVDLRKLKPVIEAVFPLQEAAKAHQLGETNRARGKIVLRVD